MTPHVYDIILGTLDGMLGSLCVLWWKNDARIGTKSVLLGVHCFFIHPFVVALGWLRCYGFQRVVLGTRLALQWTETRGGRKYPTRYPRIVEREETVSIWRPALWVAFFVHDLGYIGKPNMDGDEGETHPYFGARIMRALFDSNDSELWYNFTLLHSRFLAKRHRANPSPLCFADKMAIVIEPAWLYLPRVRWTGEIHEYMGKSDRNNGTGSKYAGMHLDTVSQRQWFADCKVYVRKWIAEHLDGREDTWTPAARATVKR